MQNFNVLLSSKFIDRIILSHDGGIVGNLIPKKILEDLKNLKGKNLYFGNLIEDVNCHGRTLDFLENFLNDIKEGRESLYNCSAAAREFLTYPE